ncbi:MAG: hypothetical protein ACPGXX_21845, partial [Planctomycetaceae bacterium]
TDRPVERSQTIRGRAGVHSNTAPLISSNIHDDSCQAKSFLYDFSLKPSGRSHHSVGPAPH